MKLVYVIQEVARILPGQRVATSPVGKPAGRRRQRSEAGWNKSIGLVLSLERDSSVVVPSGISTDGLPDPARVNADSFDGLERSILPGDRASRGRDHRGLRPEHVDIRMARGTRESLIASCPTNRGSMRGNTRGSPPRHQSSSSERPAAPPGRSPEYKQKRRRQVRRNELDSEGTPDER
jgi:hypothetical protein